MSDRNKLTIGIVGYDGENYNQDEVNLRLCEAFEMLKAKYPRIIQMTLAILSGSRGVPAYACSFAVHYYGWQTMAVTSTAMSPSDTGHISEYLAVNGSVEDATRVFFEKSDVLLCVGTSRRAIALVAYFRQLGGEVYEYEITTY